MVTHTSGLARDLSVLNLLGSRYAWEHGGLGVQQIAQALSRDKAQISRVCKTLTEFGLVNRDLTTRKYTLGHHLYALALHTQEARLAMLARPTLLDLMAKSEESAHLTVLRGGSIFTVHTELAQHPERDDSLDGILLPALSTASGRAILSTFSEAELRAWWEEHGLKRPLPEWADVGSPRTATPRATSRGSIRSFEKLRSTVLRVRRAGYAISDGELTPNIVDAATPLFNAAGVAIGAIAVGARRNRISDSYQALGALVWESADQLSRELGWQPPTPVVSRRTTSRRVAGP